MSDLSGRAGIVGIGHTEYSRNSGRSELRLAVEAIQSALSDAGLTPQDVDGILKFGMDSNTEGELVRNLGIPRLRFYGEVGYGGAAGSALVGHAAAAIASGHARVVVAFRALNERSGNRFGRADARLAFSDGQLVATGPASLGGEFTAPFGALAPVHAAAIAANRYMHQFGIGEELFGSVALEQRKYALRNPNAMMYNRPLTMDDYLNARYISYPLRLFDSCLESDGAAAVVVVGREMFRDVRPQVVAEILSATQSYVQNDEPPAGLYASDLIMGNAHASSGELFGMAGLSPSDVDVAELYEAFAHMVYLQLEGFGFCAPGESPQFVAAGETSLGGSLPTNTHGGHLSEAYIHGMNHVVEGVRQIRGEAISQVANASVALVSSGGWSSVILGRF